MELANKDILKMSEVNKMRLIDVLDYLVIKHFDNVIENIKQSKDIL